MKVLLLVDAITHPLAGIGRYSLHLAQGLARHSEVQSLLFYAHPGFVADPLDLLVEKPVSDPVPRHVLLRALSFEAHKMLRKAFFRVRARRLSQYLAHFPDYFLLPFKGRRVITVHDFSHLHYPQFHTPERVRYFERMLPSSVARADHILTDSRYVRREVIDLFGIAPGRITSVYHGVDDRYAPYPRDVAEPVLNRYHLAWGAYLFSASTFEPRKNLIRLLDAHSRLSAKLRRRFPLVLTGGRAWENEAIEKRITQLERSGEVRKLGYVPEADLPYLYAGARAAAYVSFYEGFGYPVLEAMACGVPVLASNRASLPEVGGTAALYTDPEDVESISDGLTRVLLDDDFRSQAIADGLQRARWFTWERCVQGTVEVYRKVLEGA